MKVEFRELEDSIPIMKPKISGHATELPEVKGGINIRVILNINADSGQITMTDEKQKIYFTFNNLNLAKKWADAIK